MKTTQRIVDEDYERAWYKDKLYLIEREREIEEEMLQYENLTQTFKGTITNDKESKVELNPSEI